jgi:hypothetical protein
MRLFPATKAARIRFVLILAVGVSLLGWFHVLDLAVIRLRWSPQEGDVVFQSLPHGDLVDAIEGVSGSPFSHCGVVVRGKDGEWRVIEALGDVHETPLNAWLLRGRGMGVAVFRWRPGMMTDTAGFVAALRRYAGRPYDLRYRMDDEAIYCSELVFKGYRDATARQAGKVEQLGTLNWRPFEDFIRSMEGNQLPLDREMITPRALSEAEQLVPLYRHKL